MSCMRRQVIREPYRTLAVGLLLGFLTLSGPVRGGAAQPPAVRVPAKTEAQLIQALGSKDSGTVVFALRELEDNFPSSTNAFPKMKELLTDRRVKVRRKAARVLGVLHADVDENDIKAICSLLKSSDNGEITDGLKALRGLKAPQAVPEITPFLQHSNEHLIRDACRTLAVLGNKDLIPSIEPLLKHKDSEVKKDAHSAIIALRSKS
jgi:HEAT repeat protein